LVGKFVEADENALTLGKMKEKKKLGGRERERKKLCTRELSEDWRNLCILVVRNKVLGHLYLGYCLFLCSSAFYTTINYIQHLWRKVGTLIYLLFFSYITIIFIVRERERERGGGGGGVLLR
jgi:hypothetical protein